MGVYIHFPWCLEKCPYCDFLSIPAARNEIPHEAYADAVCRELDSRQADLATRRVHSVFVGGGTPSLWEPDQLGKVLTRLRTVLHVAEDAEVTVECNPSSFSRSLGEQLQAYGVNRLSIGVQGLEQERLQFLGRLHDAETALRALDEALESGVEAVSADLIYGVYRQAPERAALEVATIARVGVSHLSAYALTIEPGTAFGARAKKGQLPLLEDDLVAASMQAVSETLSSNGFEHYEISNFARPGRQCRHNLGYWRGEPYLGLGCGAFGTLEQGQDVVRYRNPPSAERYLAEQAWPLPAADAQQQPYQQVELLSPETRLQERLMLGLRLAEGVDPQALEGELGVPLLTPARQRALERLCARNRIIVSSQRWLIPRAAWALADGVIRDLL